MRILAALLLALAVFAAALPTQGGVVHAPMLPWTDLMDHTAQCSTLEVGAGARAFTPAIDGVPWHEPFTDTNGNGYYDAPNPLDPQAHHDPYVDENLNGKWDGPWMAGYGHDPPSGPNRYYYATAVHDDVWARALAVRCSHFTLGLVSLDAVGLFVDHVQAIRAAAEGYDHIVVASTHTHDSIDTMGLWGPNEVTDGKDPRTLAHLKDMTVLALADALAALEPVQARFAAAKAPNDFSTGSVDFGFLQSDLRDPIVIDDVIAAMQFLRADGSTVATLVNWSPHPETLCGNLGEISSDYAHWLRQGIEQGGFVVKGEPQEGLGGTAVFFSGAVGGMMTTLRARVKDEAGQVLAQCSYAKAQRIGELAAWTAMDALRAAATQPVQELRVQARLVDIPIDNPFLIALNTLGIFGHQANLGPLTSTALPTGQVVPLPYIRAELDVLTLGSAANPAAQVLTVPGELLPEVFLGGELEPVPISDESECWRYNPLKEQFSGGTGMERWVAANPDIPKEPVVKDHLRGGVRFLFGLANDELGYIVPANDFVPATVYPVYAQGIDRCGDGDHYEETVSASSVMAPIIAQNLTHMLDPTYQMPPQPLMPIGLRSNDDGLPAGAWLDTSADGGYTDREDAQVYLGNLRGLPMRFGFLDSRGRDLGSDPLALQGQDPRGVWLDTNGTGAYEAGGDGVLFVDLFAVNDDAFAETV